MQYLYHVHSVVLCENKSVDFGEIKNIQRPIVNREPLRP